MNSEITATTIAWEKKYQLLLRKFLRKNAEFQGGMVCRWMRAHGLEDPPHHNMWATQLNYYAGMGWMRKTGHAPPTTEHTHINEVAVWRSNL